uniref:Uncharacterized protein n=1 Tax=Amphimedon queenslandica TaxID=400682 RepID=A0A1X7UZ39_AMPQE
MFHHIILCKFHIN